MVYNKVGDSRQVYDVTLALYPNVKRVKTGHLVRNVNDTTRMFDQQGRLPRVVPNIGPKMIATLSYPTTFLHTRRRVRFMRGGHLSYLALGSRTCPSHLHRYRSTPVMLFFGKGASFGHLRIVSVMNAHHTASCNGRFYTSFLHSLTILYPSILMMDKLTCKVSVRTRQTTLTGRLPAITILTRKLSHVCPCIRQGATVSVLTRNKLLARFLAKAGPSGRGFIDHGHVITNVDSTAVIIRSTTGKNSLVATRLTRKCRHSYFTIPKHIASRSSVNYGQLVHSGGTTLVRDTRRFIRVVN